MVSIGQAYPPENRVDESHNSDAVPLRLPGVVETTLPASACNARLLPALAGLALKECRHSVLCSGWQMEAGGNPNLFLPGQRLLPGAPAHEGQVANQPVPPSHSRDATPPRQRHSGIVPPV